MRGDLRSIGVTALFVAVVAAGLGTPSPASAETELIERLRVQAIYSNQTAQVPPYDFAGQVVPELSLVSVGQRSQLRLTYTFSATGHTTFPADISNRVNASSAFELSKRTSLLLSAEAGHSTLTNALIANTSSAAPVGVVPLTSGQLLSARIAEGTSYEVSPVVRFSQLADASYVTSLGEGSGIDGYLLNAVFSLDRAWKTDSFGGDLRASYARSHTDPFPRERLVSFALTPHWRHDISRSLTSSVAAGASVVVSPDAGTKPLVGPFGQGSLTYLLYDATFDLTVSVGTQSNALTAQLLSADQATFRASAPLSVEHAVVASGSLGFTHGSIIDRRRGAIAQPDFDSFIADVGLGWSPIPEVELFLRYQFLDQVSEDSGAAATPALRRHAVILGVQLSSRPDNVRVPTRFARRVDGGDAAPPAASSPSPPPSTSDSTSDSTPE